MNISLMSVCQHRAGIRVSLAYKECRQGKQLFADESHEMQFKDHYVCLFLQAKEQMLSVCAGVNVVTPESIPSIC